MINKIQTVSPVQVQYKPAFRSAEENNVTKPEVPKPEMSGLDTLAVYNYAALKKPAMLDLKPVELIYKPEEGVEGEKIYTSDGKLYSVVQEDENAKTIYSFDEESNDMISAIDVFDKQTGKLVKQQYNRIEDGEYREMDVAIISPETGEVQQSSIYKDGKLLCLDKYSNLPNGNERHVSYDIAEKKYYVDEYSEEKKLSRYVTLDNNKEVMRFSEYKEGKLKESNLDIDFYKGAMLKVRKTETFVFPNTMGRDKLNAEELRPAPKLEYLKDKESIEGEKSYYSNGALEKIVTPDSVEYTFTPEGILKSVKSDKLEIVNSEYKQSITEFLSDDSKKITEYYHKSGIANVRLENNGNFKEICLQKDGKPSSYYEGVVNEDGEDENSLSMYFDKHCMLESVYEY